MFQLNYDSDNGVLNIVNTIQKPINADYVIRDLDTNLCIYTTWLYIPPYGYLDLTIDSKTVPRINSTGFEFLLFEKDTDKEIFSFKRNVYNHIPQNYLYSPPKEITYGSWLSLLEGECDIIYPNSNDVVYDLGANVGVFTQYFLNKNVKHIYSFEPTPYLVKNLNQSFSSNTKVTIFDKAISPITSLIDFNVFSQGVGNTIIDRDKENKTNTIKVQGVNLEEFIQEQNLLSPTIIKMDIEGIEYEVLNNLSDNFISSVRYFYLEWHENYEDKITPIIKRFSNLGFKYKIDSRWDLQNPVGVIIFFKN